MIGVTFRPRALTCLGLLVAMTASGCTEDDLLGGTAAISGRAVDPLGTGIPGVQIGVEFLLVPAAGSPSVRPLAAGGASIQAGEAPSLGAPYPNPATVATDSGEIRIPITVPADTTLAVAILAPDSGVFEFEIELFAGRVTQDTTLLWNGRGQTGALPNGLYRVRLTAPADPPSGSTPFVANADVLINRSPALMEAVFGFNAVTDPGGSYLLPDLPIGARIQGTNTQGASLGAQRVVERVYVVYRSPDYYPEETEVVITPGDYVTVTTELTPIFPTASPVLRVGR